MGKNRYYLALKKIYVIRHGQTDYNKNGVIQGSGIDASLNETGRRQAAAFFEAYRHVPFDKIYISALRRTQETVQQFIDRGVPYEKLEDLNEISWGIAEGSPFTSENHYYYLSLMDRWKNGELDVKVEGGESPREALERVSRAFNYILEKDNERLVLVCMHGRVIRILMTWALKQPLSAMDEFRHDNAGLYVLNYNGSGFEVECYNDTSHFETNR